MTKKPPRRSGGPRERHAGPKPPPEPEPRMVPLRTVLLAAAVIAIAAIVIALAVFTPVFSGERDTDGDGLSDDEEVRRGTDPLSPDTDADGVSDGDETALGTDPTSGDTDGDALGDSWELKYFGVDGALQSSSPYGASDDPDDDGLTNLQEHDMFSGGAGPNPTLADTDADGYEDGVDRLPVYNFQVRTVVLGFRTFAGGVEPEDPDDPYFFVSAGGGSSPPLPAPFPGDDLQWINVTYTLDVADNVPEVIVSFAAWDEGDGGSADTQYDVGVDVGSLLCEFSVPVSETSPERPSETCAGDNTSDPYPAALIIALVPVFQQ